MKEKVYTDKRSPDCLGCRVTATRIVEFCDPCGAGYRERHAAAMADTAASRRREEAKDLIE